MIEAINLKKIYSYNDIEVKAVNDISITIERGDLIVILGKSGSGKSTLLNILGGIDEPTEGKLIIDNKSFYDLSDSKQVKLRAENFGFIFQNYNLIEELSAIENIRLPFDILNKPYDLEYENELIDLLDIRNRLSFYPNQLSGGEKQRIAICRALLSKPSVILADEATGNIDSTASRVFMEFIKNSNDKYNQTYIIVTHDETWIKYAKKVFYMKDGKLSMEEI